MCKIAIASVAKNEKYGLVSFQVVGDPAKHTHQAKFWSSAPWSGDLKVGDVGDAKFETVAGKLKQDGVTKWPDEKFLSEWNGVPSSKPRGGGRPAQGKTETEVLALLAIAAVKMPDPDHSMRVMVRLVNENKGKLA